MSPLPAPPALAEEPPPRPRPSPLDCRHGPHGGALDESARRLSHPEMAVARRLTSEGHRVRSQAELPWQGPTADLEVCGRRVEVKSFLGADQSRGRSAPTAASVCNKLLHASRQGEVAVIFAEGSRLSVRQAEAGVRIFAARGGWRRLASARVLGDGFDLTWQAPGLALRRRPGRDTPRPGLGIGR